ncbi:MAG: YigZ family protein [Acholeplasmataceae bacterium]|nr:YigZ family protein [Acholeplasmataceae bacterium]
MKVRYLKSKVEYTYEINKSTFIAILYPYHESSDMDAAFSDARKRYPKANHYCSASLFGDSMEQQTASDDGEPSRTAGVPILEVLKHHDVTEIICIVVRYFGGIKLGAGGLVRAYTKACSEALKLASFYYKVLVPVYEITFAYSHMDTIDHFLNNRATILEKSFTDLITYTVSLLPEVPDIDDIKHLLIAIQSKDQRLLQLDA